MRCVACAIYRHVLLATTWLTAVQFAATCTQQHFLASPYACTACPLLATPLLATWLCMSEPRVPGSICGGCGLQGPENQVKSDAHLQREMGMVAGTKRLWPAVAQM